MQGDNRLLAIFLQGIENREGFPLKYISQGDLDNSQVIHLLRGQRRQNSQQHCGMLQFHHQ